MKNRNYLPTEPCICINLRRIGLKVTELYDKALKPVGLSATQYSLLVNLCREEGCGTGELAKRVKLEKSTVVRTLQPLLRDGFIVDTSTGGGRRRCLCMTPSGEDILQKAFPLWRVAQEEVTGKLGMSYAQLVNFFEHVDL
jgi:DNA-binding MarR family transcriptional regulator